MNWLSALPHPETRHWVLLVFIASALHAHLRGKVRFGWVRALTDSRVLIALSTLMVVVFEGGQPALPDPQRLSRAESAAENWQTIRETAATRWYGRIRGRRWLHRHGLQLVFHAPAGRRFYLKWYGTDMPSAQQMCPKTVALLNQIPTSAAMFASLPPGATLVRHRDPYAGFAAPTTWA